MPKRTAVIKKVGKAAKAAGVPFVIVRQGANHTIYDLGGVMVPIGRHVELDRRYAEQIYRECEPVLGKEWWR